MSKLPSKEELLKWLQENPDKTGKREIARAFGVKGQDRIGLKQMLRELVLEGKIKKCGKRFNKTGALPPVTVLEVMALDDDGELILKPVEWGEESEPPTIRLVDDKKKSALGVGARVLCRISTEEHGVEARVIRVLNETPERSLGIFKKSDKGGFVKPVDKKAKRDWRVEPEDKNGALDGELVEVVRSGNRAQMNSGRVRVVARLGDPLAPKSVSLIAIHEHEIPYEFPKTVLDEADKMKPLAMGERKDLRNFPFVTIDPADARDHDDALCAYPSEDNPNHMILWVAIADVAAYVKSGTSIDREARERGNSSYFPDQVVPMLPDVLSTDLCSLKEDVDRPVIALKITLDENGKKIHHDFFRGMIKSYASLSYLQAQAGADGNPDKQTTPLMKSVIEPLWKAYDYLKKASEVRQPLRLDLPERKIILSELGEVTSIAFRERFDAHKLVEECMVLANVCAAETLEQRNTPLLYRVHEEPSQEKIENLRTVAKAAGYPFAKGQVLHTKQLNQLLKASSGSDDAELLHMSVLRSMSQAYYGADNKGHFGLALLKYAHFTSPIRRYADLLVHRALITAYGWGDDGLSTFDIENLDETADEISRTERRSMLAERDTTDRYLAAYMAARLGDHFSGRISGIARFGVFVRIDETGADGILPMSRLGNEYFKYDNNTQTLRGETTGTQIAIGDIVEVQLAEATPLTGGLVFDLITLKGKQLPKLATKPRGGSRRHKSKNKGKRRRQKS